MCTPDPALPLRPSGPAPRVAVIGAGLAGLAAATTLAERGVRVVLYERESYVGGKLGSWPVRVATGETLQVSHGFHAFFHHYHNLWAWMEHLGVADRFVTIADYEILRPNGDRVRFADAETTPVLNLLDLWRRGLYRLGDVMGSDARHELDAMLRYDPVATPRRYDHVSYAAFAERNALPDTLRLVFDTFSRAFFADPDRMSTAELIKSFHFYYLGHDGGLRYDYPTDDFEITLLAPLRGHLTRLGVDLRLGHPVRSITPGWTVDGDAFDDVIVATHAHGLPNVPTVPSGQRYAVLRVWLDRDVRAEVTEFAILDRLVMLDAVAVVHRIEAESRAWVATHGGAVIELHCYAVPDDATDVRGQLVTEMGQFFPEVADARILDEHFQIRGDFPAFHTGLYAGRPEVRTDQEGLWLAGDWVKLPFPAMLMEAAVSSGLLAANGILARHGLQGVALWSVPPRGLLAGIPEPPKPPHIRARFAVGEQAWDEHAAGRRDDPGATEPDPDRSTDP